VEFLPADAEEDGEGAAGDATSAEGEAKGEKKSGYLFTENILDLDELSKEDSTRSYEGVVFRVELVDEDGKALDSMTTTQLRSEADALISKRRTPGAAWSNTSGEIELDESEEGKDREEKPENDGRVIYETNGNCAPYIVKLFAATGEDGEVGDEGEELMTVHVSRSGKVTIGEEDDEDRR